MKANHVNAWLFWLYHNIAEPFAETDQSKQLLNEASRLAEIRDFQRRRGVSSERA